MSRGDLLLLVAVLAVFGVVDAAYLTWEWYAAPSASFCDLNSYWSCSEVRNSPFASIGGVVPTSVIGLGGFLFDGALFFMYYVGQGLGMIFQAVGFLLVFLGIASFLRGPPGS